MGKIPTAYPRRKKFFDLLSVFAIFSPKVTDNVVKDFFTLGTCKYAPRFFLANTTRSVIYRALLIHISMCFCVLVVIAFFQSRVRGITCTQLTLLFC